jgi:hypothetical protein
MEWSLAAKRLKLHSPLWMRLYLEMWPFSVENFKKNLGKQLKKCWSKRGELVSSQSGRYWLARMSTEPISLEIQKNPLINMSLQGIRFRF